MNSSIDHERTAIEAEMDEMLAESFPASDPPVWGSAAARMRRLEGARRAAESLPEVHPPLFEAGV